MQVANMLQLNPNPNPCEPTSLKQPTNAECMVKIVKPLSGIAVEVILVTTEKFASNDGSSLIHGWMIGGGTSS